MMSGCKVAYAYSFIIDIIFKVNMF